MVVQFATREAGKPVIKLRANKEWDEAKVAGVEPHFLDTSTIAMVELNSIPPNKLPEN